MTHRRPRTMTAALALVATLAGCMTGDPSDKGEEDAAPEDGKLDSFRNPTDHGTLRFGIQSNTAFTDSEHFHSWSFELSGPAEVDISTLIGRSNIDTVLYLYARQPGATNWGSYVARNDDDGASLASRIVRGLGAGEYRIIVKAHKLAVRGSFGVLALCSGEGCTVGDGGCAPDAEVFLPEATDFTPGCARRVQGVLAGILTSRDQYDLPLSERCSVAAIEGLALAYYRAYWSGAMGWEELIGYEEEEPRLTVERYSMAGPGAGGTLVRVDIGGDETAIDFVFDLEDELVMLYQHNQSPDVEWFCGESGEPEAESVPGEDCVASYIGAMVHGAAAETRAAHTGTFAEVGGDIAAAGAVSLDRYAATTDAPRDATFEVEVRSWRSTLWYAGASVEVRSQGLPTIGYELADEGYGAPFVITETVVGSDAVSFVCASPD